MRRALDASMHREVLPRAEHTADGPYHMYLEKYVAEVRAEREDREAHRR